MIQFNEKIKYYLVISFKVVNKAKLNNYAHKLYFKIYMSRWDILVILNVRNKVVYSITLAFTSLIMLRTIVMVFGIFSEL